MLGNFHSELPRTSRELITALGATGLIGLDDYFADKAAVLEESVAGVPAYSLRVPADWSAPRASTAIADQVLELLATMSHPVPAGAPTRTSPTPSAPQVPPPRPSRSRWWSRCATAPTSRRSAWTRCWRTGPTR